MARPIKTGLDYFPLDVDIDQDDKLAMIEAAHGVEGFGIVIKLFMKIYKEGYFYEWTDREKILFAKRINVDINLVNDVINTCLNEDLFNREIFGKYHVLTSQGIQKRYLEAVKRRKEVEFAQNYFLITDISTIIGNSKIDIFIVNDDGNRVNVNINSDNVDKSTQRKEKERKEKKSKEKNNPPYPPLQETTKEEPVPDILETEEDEEDEIKKFKQVVYNLHQSGIVKPQAMNFYIQQDLNDVIDNFDFEDPYDMLNLAIETGAKSGARTFKYIMSILEDWRRNGIKRRQDLENKPEKEGGKKEHATNNADFRESWAEALEKRKAQGAGF